MPIPIETPASALGAETNANPVAISAINKNFFIPIPPDFTI
jgi:hypothetical protein